METRLFERHLKLFVRACRDNPNAALAIEDWFPIDYLSDTQRMGLDSDLHARGLKRGKKPGTYEY